MKNEEIKTLNLEQLNARLKELKNELVFQMLQETWRTHLQSEIAEGKLLEFKLLLEHNK